MEVRRWADADCPLFRAAWDALAAAAGEPNPFYESWYLLPSLRALDPAGEVALLCLHEAGGELAGVMPLRLYPSYYGYPLKHWRNWVHDQCFCGQPLVVRGMERVFWRAALEWCDANNSGGLFLHLLQMPASGPLHDALKAELAAQGRPAATVLEERRALIATQASPEDYLAASLTGKKRKELRRQYRRLAEIGTLEIVRCRSAEDIAAWTNAFLALEAAGWKGRAGSALADDPAHAALFRESLLEAARRGRVERLTLLLDHRPIAMLATFLTPPGAYAYKTAFDEAFARYSPGVLLQCEAMNLVADPAIDWIDSCAAPDHAMIDHIWRERRRMARHSIGIGGPLRRTLFRLLAWRENGHLPGGIS